MSLESLCSPQIPLYEIPAADGPSLHVVPADRLAELADRFGGGFRRVRNGKFSSVALPARFVRSGGPTSIPIILMDGIRLVQTRGTIGTVQFVDAQGDVEGTLSMRQVRTAMAVYEYPVGGDDGPQPFLYDPANLSDGATTIGSALQNESITLVAATAQEWDWEAPPVVSAAIHMAVPNVTGTANLTPTQRVMQGFASGMSNLGWPTSFDGYTPAQVRAEAHNPLPGADRYARYNREITISITDLVDWRRLATWWRLNRHVYED